MRTRVRASSASGGAVGVLTLALALSMSAGCLWLEPAPTDDESIISTSLTVVGTDLSPSFMQIEDRPMSALDQLGVASQAYGFSMTATDYGWGTYVTEIAGVAASGSRGWVFEVDGARVAVGAQAYMLEEGDAVVWKLASG